MDLITGPLVVVNTKILRVFLTEQLYLEVIAEGKASIELLSKPRVNMTGMEARVNQCPLTTITELLNIDTLMLKSPRPISNNNIIEQLFCREKILNHSDQIIHRHLPHHHH